MPKRQETRVFRLVAIRFTGQNPPFLFDYLAFYRLIAAILRLLFCLICIPLRQKA